MTRALLVIVVVAIVALVVLALVTVLGVARVERRFPPIGSFVEVDGQRLHYVDRGEGVPIVLVHGASANLRDMGSSLVPLLAERFRVLAFDRPGYGYSARGEGPWPDPGRLASLVLDAAEALGADRPVVLGHSWAGSVVMTALVREPERVRGGVLLAGVAGHWVGSVGPTYDIGALPVIGPTFARTLLHPVGSFVLPSAVASVVAPDPVPDDYLERIGAPLALRPATFLANVEDMTRLSEFMQSESRRFPEIRTPLLAIHGTADELVPFWNHGERLTHVVPHLEVALLDGAGHAPHHTRTAEVVEHVGRFVESLSDR